MGISRIGGHAAARRPVEKTGLNQIGLVKLLDGVALLADGDGQGVESDRVRR